MKKKASSPTLRQRPAGASRPAGGTLPDLFGVAQPSRLRVSAASRRDGTPSPGTGTVPELAAETAALRALNRYTPPGAAIHLPGVRTPTITVRQPDGSLIVRAGKPVVLAGADEVGTVEAAKIIGCDQNSIYRYIDDGLLVEGRDWRQIATGRRYYIRRSAIIALSARRAGEAPE